ncbi:MAG TPA: nuclear transport factor 2 family protein [Solirubrobacterales bacterium]|nr:nuclear transport factor 2 family protein [Solirubrobacterales bacterium]
MKFDSLEAKVEYLLDRAEITDVINRYCYGMDSRNWELYRSCWVDEIMLDLTELEAFFDEPVESLKADDYVKSLVAFFDNLPQSQHMKIPSQWEFDGDKATVLSLMQGKHWMPTNTGGPIQTVVGYYRDDFVKTPDGWKMCGMKELVHWNEGNSHVLDVNIDEMTRVLKEVAGS